MATRRRFLAAAAASLAAPCTALASSHTYEDCSAAGCSGGIARAAYKPFARHQKDTLLCWAATLESVFAWYKRDVPQMSIVKQVYGGPGNVSSGTMEMTVAQLNRDYLDANGRRVGLRSKIMSVDFNRMDINRRDLTEAMVGGRPCVLMTMSHSMVMIAARYNKNYDYQFQDALLMDPFYPDHFRLTLPTELLTPPQGTLRLIALPTYIANP